MSRSSTFAVAAIAALGAAVLAPTAASAAQGPSFNSHQGPSPQGSALKVQKALIGHDKITWTPKKVVGNDPNTWSPKKLIGNDPNASTPKKLIGNDPKTWTPKKIIGGDPNTWTPNAKKHHHHHHHWWFWYARYRQYHVVPGPDCDHRHRAGRPESGRQQLQLLDQRVPAGRQCAFKDLCTKEAAMATPEELKAQASAPQVR